MTTHHKPAKITLIENSTAGNPPKAFADQSCEIEHEPTITVTSADGIKSHARQPTRIVWYEGKAEWFGRNAATGLMAVTNVRIVASDGKVLIDDWELITNPGVPRNVDRGVQFFVLRPEHDL